MSMKCCTSSCVIIMSMFFFIDCAVNLQKETRKRATIPRREKCVAAKTVEAEVQGGKKCVFSHVFTLHAYKYRLFICSRTLQRFLSPSTKQDSKKQQPTFNLPRGEPFIVLDDAAR